MILLFELMNLLLGISQHWKDAVVSKNWCCQCRGSIPTAFVEAGVFKYAGWAHTVRVRSYFQFRSAHHKALG